MKALHIPHAQRRELHQKYRVGVFVSMLLGGWICLVFTFLGVKGFQAFHRRFPNFWGKLGEA